MNRTPGPWHLSLEMNDRPIVGPDNRAVAWPAYQKPRSVEEGDANGRLLAAAPELLESLQHLRESYADLCQRNGLAWREYGVVVSAEAAIAKATGGVS